MFKKGFTLQELLITMAIIGVVAAITAPAIMNIVPDKSKAAYIKCYNTLANITDELLSDPSMYYTEYNNNGTESCSGLNCMGMPQTRLFQETFDAGSWAHGANDEDSLKFGYCLASKLNIQEEFGENLNQGTLDLEFTTLDGIHWRYGNHNEHEVEIDLNGEDGPNEIYSANNTAPDRFIWYLDNDGGIHPGDALGLAYLQNPTNLHATTEDKELAEQIVDEAGSSDDWEKLSEAITEINKKNAK